MLDFLHVRRDFEQLLALVADERGLDPMLVEKDYWIMHCLWGLQAQGSYFELKGGHPCRRALASSTASPKTSTSASSRPPAWM